MNRIDVLCFVLTATKARAQPAGDNGTANIEVELALLVRRLVAGERISRVERFILEKELPVSVKRADAAAVDDLWSRLPSSALAETKRTIFRSECVVVDPDVLGL